MDNQKFGRAPDFTTACIVMFGINVAWVLLFLFAIYGLIAAVFAGLVLNHALAWLDERKRVAAQATTTRPPQR